MLTLLSQKAFMKLQKTFMGKRSTNQKFEEPALSISHKNYFANEEVISTSSVGRFKNTSFHIFLKNTPNHQESMLTAMQTLQLIPKPVFLFVETLFIAASLDT